MAFYFSSVTKALYDTDVFPVASLPANKVEITQAAYTDLMTKQNQGYVILADGSGNPYTVNQSEATATDIKHAASVASTIALGHVKIGNTMTAANDGTLDVKDDAITADKVKDNETLPVNVSGNSGYLAYGTACCSNAEIGSYSLMASIDISSVVEINCAFLLAALHGNAVKTGCAILELSIKKNVGVAPKLLVLDNEFSVNNDILVTQAGDTVYIYASNKVKEWFGVRCIPVYNGSWGSSTSSYKQTTLYDSQYDQTKLGTDVTVLKYNNVIAASAVGSTTTPVYVDENGQVKPCDASPFIINKMVKEDGTDLDFFTSIPFAVGYDEGFKTIGKLNISPSNKNCIIDITFLMRLFNELDENDNSEQTPAATFAVFVGSTEISSFYLQGSISHNDDNYAPYSSSPSFRCTFSANINNTIYIKVKKSGYYARKLNLFEIKIQGLAFYKD